MRAMFLVAAVMCGAANAYAQQVIVHIRVQVVDRNQKPTPVSHHALLISEDPPSEPPRRVVTAADGTVDVRMRPGAYTIESERPVSFEGRAYEWTEHIIVRPAGTSLDLTANNAKETASSSGASLDTDPSFLLNRWQHSVVAVWTPLVHRSGLVVDATNGLIVTNVHVAGSAPEVEVQLTPEVKVRARIVETDAATDLAVLQIHPSASASIAPLRPDCGSPALPIAAQQELAAIASPMRGAADLVFGVALRIDARGGTSDLRLAPAGAGGPVFAAGRLIGMTSAVGTRAEDNGREWASHIVGVDALCSVLAAAEKKVGAGAAPDSTHLPVEPAWTVPADVLKARVERSAGSLSPPQISSADFDVALITPLQIAGAQASSFVGARQRAGGGLVDAGSRALAPVRDFANWSDYVADLQPLLLIRATPKLAEGFWNAVGRAAAQTQGIALPAVKRAKAGFARMRAFCGEAEVMPIHPFVLEQRVSESDVIYEGLYAFDVDALGPQCATVKLTFYSDKDPGKGDTRQVDAGIIRTIADEFAAYRASAPSQAPR